jgi:anti-sigma factor RsiW
MLSNDELYEAMLVQRYYEDSCTPEERAYIEGHPGLLARAAAMRRDDAVLQQLFSDAAGDVPIHDDRPSPQELIAYVDGTLTESRRRFVEQCALRFPDVREEIRLLRRLGGNPLLSD